MGAGRKPGLGPVDYRCAVCAEPGWRAVRAEPRDARLSLLRGTFDAGPHKECLLGLPYDLRDVLRRRPAILNRFCPTLVFWLL
jgi:hypothetical protein